MAQPLGVAGARRGAYLDTLATSHRVTWDYQVLDLDDRRVGGAPAPADGQITVDAAAEVTRTWSGALLDPDHRLRLDSDAPGAGAVFGDRLLRIRHTITVPDPDARFGGPFPVTVTPFTGRMTKLDRDGDQVAIECQGLEVFGLTGCVPLTLSKGTRVVAAIEKILRARMGHRRFRFPQGIKARLARDVTVGWADDARPWVVATRLARSIDMQLYMAGDGYAVLRRPPGRAAHVFAWPGHITTEPKISYALGTANIVIVHGKKGVTAKADASDLRPRHSLSAAAMARHGVPIYVPHLIDDDKIATTSAAKKLADSTLKRLLREQATVTFDAVPVYHLDELDLVATRTPDTRLVTPLRQATLPTGATGDMAVGYVRNIAEPSVRRRRRR